LALPQRVSYQVKSHTDAHSRASTSDSVANDLTDEETTKKGGYEAVGDEWITDLVNAGIVLMDPRNLLPPRNDDTVPRITTGPQILDVSWPQVLKVYLAPRN
jgi:hypothetical protein